MLRNYLYVAWRSMVRGRLYSVINVLGLAIGLACFFLIALYIKDELSYDRHFKNASRLYRVIEILKQEGQGEQSASCPFPLGPALAQDQPALVEHAVRFFNFQDPQHTLRAGTRKFNESRLFVADSNVFEVFGFPLEKGDPRTALVDTNCIVLSRELAQKYFGDEDPMGKLLRFDGITDMKVTGVLGDIPQQSHIHFDGLISFSSLRNLYGPLFADNWVWNPNWTYVLLREGVKAKDLEQYFPDFVDRHYPEHLKQDVEHRLQPITDIHLRSDYSFEIEPNNDINLIRLFSVIGFFILLIACVNFMNLSTARSSARAREVGIRKVVGANRSLLIAQFLFESVFLSFISVLLSLVIAELLLPVFNLLAGKSMQLSYFASADLLGIIIVTGLATGLFSGAYPALFLSSFQPAAVLKGRLAATGSNSGMRKALVVFQFSVSVALIIGTAVVYSQLGFMRSADPGFNSERLLLLPVRPPMSLIFDPLVKDLEKSPHVIHVTRMNDIVGKHHNTHEYSYSGLDSGRWVYLPSLLVDEAFIPTIGIQLLAGRNFSKEHARDDSLAVIVNESMLKQMKWGSPASAIGRQLSTPTGNEKVIGVVKDFHFVSLLHPVGPFVLDMPHRWLRSYWTRYIGVKLKDVPVEDAIKDIRKRWERNSGEFPFEYVFLDQELRSQYRPQENIGRLASYFSILAIFIACMGLFALATFSAEQRSKEIGIRKAMGASVSAIVFLLSKDFMKLVLLAIVIACPLSWLLLQQWLKGFAYHVEIGWQVFVFAGLVTIVISLITVVIRSVKTAWLDPVSSLRYE